MKPENRTILVLMGLWLVGSIAADMVNDSSPSNRIKGMARVIFFAIDFSTFTLLIGRNRKRIILLAFALGLAELYRVSSYGIGEIGTAWKYGGDAGVSIMLTLVGSYFCYKGRYTIFALCMLALAFANLHYGYRSQIAVVMVAVTICVPIFAEAAHRSLGMRRVRIAAVILLSLGAVWVSQKVLNEAVARGYFNESLEDKFQAQSAGKLGVLIGARPEIPVAIQAIIDAPIFGHGSYAVDPKYEALLADYQFRFGYSGSDTPEDLEDPGIPTHSHLTAAWVESGVLGSLLWFYLIWLNVRGIIVIADTRPVLSPLYAWLFITFIWDILFSPFGYDRRVFEGFFIVLLVNLTSQPVAVVATRQVRPFARKVFRAAPNRPVLPRLPRPS